MLERMVEPAPPDGFLDRAFEYAKTFYSGLLMEGDRLERAFLKARRKAFKESQTNKAWAAATLVLEA